MSVTELHGRHADKDPWAIPGQPLGAIVKEWLEACETHKLYKKEVANSAASISSWRMEVQALSPRFLLSQRSGLPSRWLWDLKAGRINWTTFHRADRLLNAMGLEHEWYAGGRMAAYYPTVDPDEVLPAPELKLVKRRRHCRLSDQDVRNCHTLVLGGMSFAALGRETWERFGYANAAICAKQIAEAIKAAGLSLPTRSELIARARRTHGILDGYEEAQRNNPDELRRMTREAQRYYKAGTQNPICQGLSKRSGRRCRKYAMNDSAYCVAHAPETAEVHTKRISKARVEHFGS